MTISALALAATLLIGNAADPAPRDSQLTFARDDIRPVAGMLGLYTLPSLTRRNGASVTVGIVAPSQGLIVFLSFDCPAGTFTINGRAELSDAGGDRVAIGETVPPRDARDSAASPVKDATNPIWRGVAAAVCGEPA